VSQFDGIAHGKKGINKRIEIALMIWTTIVNEPTLFVSLTEYLKVCKNKIRAIIKMTTKVTHELNTIYILPLPN